MNRRCISVCLCVIVLGGAVWLAGRGGAVGKSDAAWIEVVPGSSRSPGQPAGYALVHADRAVLIDAPCPPEGLYKRGVKRIERVLLTHHHRDSLAAVTHLTKGVPVQAPLASAPWITPAGVTA